MLPTGKDLPPPEADAAAKKAADWPDDPDIKRVKAAQERPSASASPSSRGRRRQAAAAEPDEPKAGPPRAGSRAGEAPGLRRKTSAAPSTNAELGSKGIISMFSGLWAPKEEYTPLHRRAAAHQPDRAADRLPDALARRSPTASAKTVDRATVDRQARARQIESGRRIEPRLRRSASMLRQRLTRCRRTHAKTARDRIAEHRSFASRPLLGSVSSVRSRGSGRCREPCSPVRRTPRRSRISATSRSPTASRSSSCRTAARRSSPTWSGTRSAPPTRRRASPASPISSNI